MVFFFPFQLHRFIDYKYTPHLEAKLPSESGRPEHEHGNVCFPPTPETYCGYKRGKIANTGGYKEGEEFNYSAPDNIRDGTVALGGKFIAEAEYVESAEAGAILLLRFHATEVNLVLAPTEQEAVVEVEFSGESKAPPNDIFGGDVEKGKIKVDKPAMYNLLKSSNLMDGVVSIKVSQGNPAQPRADRAGFRAYAFTFSGCEVGSHSV